MTNTMTTTAMKQMILDILGTADYDLAKNYDPSTAEEPEYVEENMDVLVKIVERHLTSASS